MANVTTSDNRNNNPKVNPAKFMGSAFAAGSALSKKVAANARKITLIKKVLQAQKIAIGESLKPVKDPLLEGVQEQIRETNSILEDIGNALALDFANRIAEEKEDTKNLKKQKDIMRKSLAEKGLEGLKGIGRSVGSGISKVGSVISSTFKLDNLIQAIKLLGAGIAVNAAFEWLKKDENLKKLKDIFKWTTENLDKIILTAGALFVGNQIMGLIGLATTIKAIGGIFLNPVIAGAILFMVGAKFGEKGDLSHFQKKAIKSLAMDYGGDKDAIIADLEAARGNRRDLHKRFGLQSGPLGGRGTVIDDMIKAINEFSDSDLNKKAIGGDALGLNIVGERGPELAYFGEKANIVANHNIPKFLDDISKFSKSKVNIIEMDLGTIKKQPSTKRVSLPETTEVSYVSSVNLMNSYMTKTPELHGICV